MKNLPKLIASDIGGTLMQNGAIIPDYTASVLKQLVNNGIPVVLITGYNQKTTFKYTSNLGDEIILMPQNGTICFKGKTKIWEYRIEPHEVSSIHDYLQENGLPIIIYKGIESGFSNYFIGPPEFELSEAFERISQLTDFRDITGISTLVPNDIALSVRQKLESLIGSKFQLIYVREKESSWLEILQSESRKDLALKRLCREMNIPLSDVAYFGDNFNDVEALRLVGHPVLVSNAQPELKEEFQHVVQSVHEEGVAHYLDKLYQLNILP